jgi:hypothetical protein
VTARLAALVLVLGAGFMACTEWLEVDDGGDEAVLELPVGRPMVLPSAPAEAGGRGPIVPSTPGLRVPLAGYWTRARLDTADVLLPYTWASLVEGRGFVLLRIEGAMASADEPTAVASQSFRVVIPITLPPGTDTGALAGLTLGKQALAQAAVSIRTSPNDLWIIDPDRLTFDVVRSDVVVGTLEGEARRGARGQRARRFESGFIALRAPEHGGAGASAMPGAIPSEGDPAVGPSSPGTPGTPPTPRSPRAP